MIGSSEVLVPELEARARAIRRRIVEMAEAQPCHIGGSLSMAEILAVLYFHVLRIQPEQPDEPGRDHFILSKGHATPALYAALAERGFFSPSELKTFLDEDSRLPGHACTKTPGVEVSTGSMGHGLSIGLGIALGCRMDRSPSRVYVLLGDGELQEGSNWEAAMAAAHLDADNLIAVVDRNRYQASALTERLCSLEPLSERWSSFGWGVASVDGHQVSQLLRAFRSVPCRKGRPTVILAHTVKGKGVSWVESGGGWHFGRFSPEQASRALAELRA
ncbi:MAG: transketolase [Planctomycetes bacterium]|nr:transketolase [Planctomycetota bacterium]